ncbi:hypothetical protein RCL1_001629 [Eukaryota sp. TZLM3-RCL]
MFDIPIFTTKLQEIIDIDCLPASDDDPYVHKYEARNLMNDFLNELEHVTTSLSDSVINLCKLSLSVRIAINQALTEETSPASRSLVEILPEFELMLPQCQDPSIRSLFVPEYMEGLNALAVIKANRSDQEEALEALQKCLTFARDEGFISSTFSDFEEGGLNDSAPSTDDSSYVCLPGTSLPFDIVTQTLYVLAQVRTSEGEKSKAANLLKIVLSRRKLSSFTDDDKKTWSRHLIDLAEYFITTGETAEAEVLIDQGREVLVFNNENDQDEDVLESRANLDAFSGKICLLKLQTLYSQSLNQKNSQDFINQCRSETISLFNDGVAFLESALKFFVIDGYVTDHISILRVESQLYKYRSLLDSDLMTCLSFNQKRPKLLEPIIPTLNHSSYAPLIREMRLEVADAYYQLIETKKKEYQGIAYTEEVHKRCVSWARTGIRHCLFARASSIRDGPRRDDVAPIQDKDLGLLFDPVKEYPNAEDFLKAVKNSVVYIGSDFLDVYLSTCFLTAKLWSCIPALSPMQEAAFCFRSWLYYESTVTVLNNHSEGSDFGVELEIAEKMSNLLREKIAIIKNN